MGRDDARTVPGLQGGTAPARAFHDFMMLAVANRPAEPFETQVPLPDWQLTPEEEMYGDTAIDANSVQPMVDENGLPINPPPTAPGNPQQQPMIRPDGTGEPSQQELDQAFPPQQAPPQQRPPPPPRTREPGSAAPSEPPQSRPNTT
jgi:penicillin-binding protein 1A